MNGAGRARKNTNSTEMCITSLHYYYLQSGKETTDLKNPLKIQHQLGHAFVNVH
jgi:hypothetical protein